MEIKRAAELLRGLADGVDPMTGRPLPDESVYNRPEIIRATQAMGYTEMTEIQQKAIPLMLAGHDMIAKAPTGTVKTGSGRGSFASISSNRPDNSASEKGLTK